MANHADKWFTYMHPRDELGRSDYSKLLPFSLAQILASKTLLDAQIVHREVA